MRKRLFFLLFLNLLWMMPGILSAAERTYNVLFIQSHANHSLWHDRLTVGLKEGLAKGGVKANVATEYLNAGFWTFSSERIIMKRICERARQRNTDIIVTSGDEAFHTLTHCGDSLPFQLPIVISGIKYPNEAVLKKMPNVCGFTVKTDFEALLHEAKRVFPNRTEIVCLSDSSQLGLKGASELEKVWSSFQEKYPEYSWKKLNVQAQTPNHVVSFICYEYNTYNRIVIAPKWTPFLTFIGKNSKAPVFACQNIALTNGVFAAYDVEPCNGTREAGKRVAQLLKGESPASFGVENLPGTFLYDFKQLKFFHVDMGRVEKQGIVLNIPLMERYRIWFILSYLLILSVLILLVVWLYRANRRQSRKHIRAQTRLLIQHRLIEQRDEFDNILGSIRDGLITYDTDLRIHFVNFALMKMLDLSPEAHSVRYYENQMAGSIFHIYFNGKNILFDLLEKVRLGKKPVSIPEKAFMQENFKGTYFPVSGEVVPIFAKERMTGMAIVCRNISDEEMQKRFFNLAVEESSIFPWQYNIHMDNFHFPGELLNRFNYQSESDYLTKDEMILLIHPDDLSDIQECFDSILLGRELNSRINCRLQNADGSYEWWEFRSTAFDGLKPEAPYMVLGICQSIQRYKDTEEELIAARDKALQADTLKSAFLANMSHEIRTPLNSIVGFSDLLKNIDAFTAEEVKQFVETININCTLLLALMSDILDLSRIESGTMDFQFVSCNLSLIMQEVYDSQRLDIPEGVSLCTELPEGDGKFISTDTVRLKQVVNNLINNAKKFTAEGSITLGYLVEEPGYTTIFVEDTGNGISEEAQKHVFERFFKADNFTQGAGLGLSICRTIVNRMQGVISVTAELGKGTRFEVRLPDAIEECIPGQN